MSIFKNLKFLTVLFSLKFALFVFVVKIFNLDANFEKELLNNYAIFNDSKNKKKPLNSSVEAPLKVPQLTNNSGKVKTVNNSGGDKVKTKQNFFGDDNSIRHWKSAENVKAPFCLGPTGILAFVSDDKKSYKVRTVLDKAPAYGLIKSNDEIIGVNGKKFSDPESFRGVKYHESHLPHPLLASAINRSEGRKGKLALMVLRGSSTVVETVEIPAIGNWSMRKKDILIERNIELLLDEQNSQGLWGNNQESKKSSVLSSAMIGLALLSVDPKKNLPAAERVFKGLEDISEEENLSSWRMSYRGMFYAEYYKASKDERSKRALEKLVKKALKGSFYYGGVYGYGHGMLGGSYLYSGLNVCTVHMYLMLSLAHQVGIELPNNMNVTFAKSIEKISPNAKIGYSWSVEGLGEYNKHEEIKENQTGLRTGLGAAAHRIFGGRRDHFRKMTSYITRNSEFADVGHISSGSMGWFWSVMSLSLDSPVELKKLMEKWEWHFDLSHNFDGSIYHQPAVSGTYSRTSIKTGSYFNLASRLILLSAERKNIMLTGKDLTSEEVYKHPTVASRIHYKRKNRILECAEAMNLLGDKAPSSLNRLFKKLKKIDCDDKDYVEKTQAVYKNLLGKVVGNIFEADVNKDIKNRAALCVLGINHDNKYNDRSKSLEHSVTAPNYGECEVVINVYNEANKEIMKPMKRVIKYDEQRNFEKLKQNWEGVKDKQEVEMILEYKWKYVDKKGIEKSQNIQRSIKNKTPIKTEWVKNVSNTGFTNNYGPFVSEIKTFSSGVLAVLINGMHLECGIGPETVIEYKGVKAKVGHFKKLSNFNTNFNSNSDENFKMKRRKVRFTYQNAHNSLTKPVCLYLEILEEMGKDFEKTLKEASKSTKELRPRWVNGTKKKNSQEE